jgi:hypothetical protein
VCIGRRPVDAATLTAHAPEARMVMEQTSQDQRALKALFKYIQLGLIDKVRENVGTVDLTAEYDDGFGSRTPLNFALRCNNSDIVRLLLDAGADPTGRDSELLTPLHDVHDAALAALLIERGADVNARATEGTTPLHLACVRDDIDVVTVLLDHGAEVDAVDDEGRSAYRRTDDMKVRDLLLSRGSIGLPHTNGKAIAALLSTAELDTVRADRGCVGVDALGNVWFWGYSGMHRYDGEQVTRYDFEEHFAVDSIIAGPEGTVYFATNAGLLRYQDGEFRLYTSDDSALHNSHITYATGDGNGRVYIIGYGDRSTEYMSVFDGTAFTLLRSDVDFPSGLEIQCLAFDRDGGMIIGTRDGGVAWRKGDVWERIERFNEVWQFGLTVYDIVVTPQEYWFGTVHGVYRLAGGPAENLPVGLAQHLCWDGASLWIGTNNYGLTRFRDDELTTIGRDETGPTLDTVEGLALGADGRLWLTTDDGAIFFVADGVVHRVTRMPEPPPERERKPLRPLPSGRLLPKDEVPADIAKRIRKPPLEGISAGELLRLVRPAIGWDLRPKRKSNPAVGASKFGGLPDLPEDLAWPTFDFDEDRNMPFLMQINLAEVHRYDLEGLLPPTGMLYFFTDTSPDDLNDCAVLYTDAPVEQLARRDLVEDLVDRRDEDDFIALLPQHSMEFSQCYTLPSARFLAKYVDLTEEDEDALWKLHRFLEKREASEPAGTGSRLLGWPESLQGEVVRDFKTIALLQINGWELSPNSISDLFEHWCSDGLIHVLVGLRRLRARDFSKARATMAYT